MNSLKDLYLLLGEENLTSPAHQADKKTAADEHQLSPTIKVGGLTRIDTHIQSVNTLLAVLPAFPCRLVLSAALWLT